MLKTPDLLKEKRAAIDLNDPRLYINRELSLLEFHRRVLQEAQDETNPLLERVKFLAIVGNILDEFFMVRVAGLKKQVEAGVVDVPPDGLTPAEQLAAIRKVAGQLMVQARECLRDDLIPRLKQNGIQILNYAELSEKQKEPVNAYFNEVIFPVLTPLAFDPGHPFPHISNLSLNLAVLVRDKHQHFARIKVPGTLPRLLPIKRSSGSVRRDGTVPHNHYFVWLEQVIAANLDALFPGMKIMEVHPFRVTRDADMVIQELEASDLLETIEEGVKQRRFGSVVRVTVNNEMPSHVREILIENLEMDHNDVYTMEGPLGLSGLMSLYNIDRYDLKEQPFLPALPAQLKNGFEGNFFSAIRRGDILVHHPYDSFTPVVDFLSQAARDPDVLAIKQTLYRVGRNSPVVKALLDASENRKQVAVLVELKARFDEESNIEWAKALERVGVHVIYGLLGLKTHSKVALVVRKEGDHIRRYVHLATGNYNAVTAQLYEDIGLFTADEDIGADATDLFNYLTGYSAKKDYRKLLVAPINLRSRLEELIQREVDFQQRGEPGHLIFKMNSLVDKGMIQCLYRASQAGVKVDLIVRGMCCLRPGLPGVSENIRVISIVGRFLEHSRVYYFRNGGNEEIFLGSADLMPRNINARVEVLFPLEDATLVRRMRDGILENYLKDNVKARRMCADGRYERPVRPVEESPFSIQAHFLAERFPPR
jgi:polyphosphate kinase